MAVMCIEKLFEHNNWANQQLITACGQLSDDQLDAQPKSAAYGSIRQTLTHIATAQVGYLRLLTRPVEERRQEKIDLSFHELAVAFQTSGERLLELVRKGEIPAERLETSDDYWVESWVVLLQALDHAAEHRQQVCSQFSALGLVPPALDGWSFGEARGGLVEK